jgi:hypothetical protein
MKYFEVHVGDKIRFDYGEGNVNNETVEVRAEVDNRYFVVRKWRGFRGWEYSLIGPMKLWVNRDLITINGKTCRWHPLVTKIGDWSTDYDRCKAYEIGKIPGYCTPQTCPLLEGDGDGDDNISKTD